MKSNSAIVLAAGSGRRLGKAGNGDPKCLQKIQDKHLIEWQIEILNSCGITDVTVATGYRNEMLNRFGSRQIQNIQFETTNMVYTLHNALKELNSGPILVTYGDILVSPKSIQLLLDSDSDISILSDENFLEYWSERSSNPISDLETFVLEKDFVIEIGGTPETIAEVQGQYMGISYFSKAGFQTLRNLLHAASCGTSLNEKPLESAFMTDLFQELIMRGNQITSISNRQFWIEIDTAEDLKNELIEKRINQIHSDLEGMGR